MKLYAGPYWIEPNDGTYGWNGVPSPESGVSDPPTQSDVVDVVTNLVTAGGGDAVALQKWLDQKIKLGKSTYAELGGKLGLP